MEYIIEVKNLEKKYGNFKALNNLNIHIEKGSIYGLVGKNGAGKTTLIRLLCGLEEPTSGTYSIYRISNKDKNINKERQKIGAIIEYPYLYYNMNAYDNIKEVNSILNKYEKLIVGRMGLPYKEKNIRVISIVVDGTTGEISAITGKIGKLKGVSVKAAISKTSF